MKRVGVCITRADRFRGTGDEDDEEDVRYDRDVPAFHLWYESIVDPSQIWSWHGQFASLDDAIAAIKRQCGGIEHGRSASRITKRGNGPATRRALW